MAEARIPPSRPPLFDDFEVDSSEGEQESWLMTYLDVMTLLLVMLIVLLAFSDRVGGESVSRPMPTSEFQSEQVEIRPRLFEPPTGTAQPERDLPAADPLADLPTELLGDDIEVLVEAGRISLRVSSEILFPSGQADLTPQGADVVRTLADVLLASPHDVAVEGHTDDVPIQTARFQSNWDLSTARATSVVRHLLASGIAPERLRATGYAETRPLAPNDSPKRRAVNRRVELILEMRERSSGERAD